MTEFIGKWTRSIRPFLLAVEQFSAPLSEHKQIG